MKISKFILILILLSSSFSVFAQTTQGVSDTILKKHKIVDNGKFMFTPFIAPGYTPELGALLAAGGLMSFKTTKKDSSIQRTSIPFSVGYTTTGAIVANAIITSYWLKDKLRIDMDFAYKDMPDHYWGIGYENGNNKFKTDSTTAYNRLWWWFNPRFIYQVKPKYFVGLNVDYNYTEGTNAADDVIADYHYSRYGNKPMNSGLGLILRYDSRDIPVDAWSGMFIDFRATNYNTAFGGDNNYNVYQLDYRQYETIGRKGTVLAWQAKLRITEGDVPYGEMSQIGTPWDLRGYTWGRYRDNNMFFFLTEYRHKFFKQNGELSKHGVVAWIASGTIFNSNTTKQNTHKWLPNYGIGYRLELQPRMAVRLDFGIARENSGFYFNFNQAF
ncbi:MAG: BamA/TamA family outer membrane protein [Ichthyobacteriaceae bacterium]|nr:BamA/TamA family outer membrane protein [Ichthyobacteriaceae bacterium]